LQSISKYLCRIASAAALLAVSIAGTAQTITGSISGTVTDSTGAAVKSASITAISTQTNVQSKTQTNDSGVYNLRFLQVGQYKVTVEAAGFAPQTLGPFALESGQDAKFDAKLGVEGSTQSVDINAALIPLLNTENPTLGTTLDTNAINSIPLIGRNFTSLTVFTPGAVTSEPSSLTGANAIERNTNGAGQASVNGNRQQSNNFLLDGVDINETINNSVGYSPSPDALDQVRIITANANAEFGNVNGGDVIALLKSGTNSFHGSIYDYFTNQNLTANTWANKHSANPIDRNKYTQQVFGATLGGPILKDRLFFFMDYTGARFHQGGASFASVATAKMRAGDFSELLDRNLTAGSPIQLYNTQAGFAPYVNNQIGAPTNPVARYLYAHPELYPLPNATPLTGTVITNNYVGASSTRRFNDQGDIKINGKIKNDVFFGRYSQSNAGDVSTVPLALQFPGPSVYPTKGVALDWVHPFSSTLINELQAGFTRTRWEQGQPVDTTGVFGFNGNSILGINATQPYQGFVAQNFSGQNGKLTNPGNSATSVSLISNNFTYFDNLTYQKGRHLLKAGVQFLRYQQNTFYPGNDGAMGNFNYNGNFTQSASGTGGYNVADFNQDHVFSIGRGAVAGRSGQRQWRDALFFQDDWKATSNLTLNLGLRWEFDQPIYEVNNKQANIDFATKTVQLAGVNGASRALYNPVWTNFMPRVGFAYNPMPRVVLRGGYGITTYLEGTGANLRLNYNPPFLTAITATGSAPTASDPGRFYTAENGFALPGSPITTYRAWQQNLRPAFLQEFSLTTEYQINNATSLVVGYVGESGQHLITAGAANQLASPCVLNGVRQTNYQAAGCTNAPFSNLVGQSGSVILTASNAMMNYNALQISLREREYHGISGTFNYTYGRAMTNSTGFYGVPSVSGASAYAQNFYDNHAEYGPAGQDIRHNFNANMTYKLPFGRGRQFGGNMNRAVDEVVGGWQVAATALVYSGFPVTMNSTTSFAGTNNSANRPNQYRKLRIVNQSTDHWFGTDPSTTLCGSGVDNGTCAYGAPAQFTYGSAAVGTERSPRYNQMDASVFKDFHTFREQSLNVRVDAANVLNMTSLGNPDNTPGSSTFGQITTTRSVPRQLQVSAKYVF